MESKIEIQRKNIKKEAHKSLKKTYLKSILIVFIFTLVMTGGYNFTSSVIDDYDLRNNTLNSNFETLDRLVNEEVKKQGKEDEIDQKKATEAKGVLAPIINKVTADRSAIFSFVDSFRLFYYKHNISAGMLSLFSGLILVLIYIFIKLVLEIGKNRYFLESRRYTDTRLEKILFPYRTRKTLHLSGIIFLRNIYLSLWGLTVIGWFIKKYEYLMIPYILAENPKISRKEAFNISKEMMHGFKWQAFKLDITLIGWELLAIVTLGFSNILYANAYKEFIYAELYIFIRKTKKDDITYGILLNDDYLDIANHVNKEYPISKYKIPLWYKKDFKSDYNKKYPIKNLILFFFTFSFIGWCWEVLLHLVVNGTFVNRGMMFGPWLPIYGVGAILILALLQPFRKRPVIYFIASMILAGVLEYSTSWFLEVYKGMKWWDYSGYFLNINGRICLEGLLVFGFGAAAVTYFIGPLLNYYYSKIKPQISLIICSILLVLFCTDVVYSSKHPNTGQGVTSYENTSISLLNY